MSEILERAKAHFRAKFENELQSIEVPEWGEANKPLKIYFRPMTLGEQNTIYKYVREGSLESLAQTIIVRARDENGERLFKDIHKTELMRYVDADVVQRIVEKMSGSDLTVSDAEKN